MSDIIDLGDARARKAAGAPSQDVILDALDTLALALTEHGHKWTGREVALYELAVHARLRTGPKP